MDHRPAKRPKLFRGEDDYLPGNIIEVELHNFMTFDHLTCKPCSRLNLVIGPNGSGKSSLVCAIALGLGGEPQLLGRATSVGAYVKRGEESGYIKISLRGDTVDEPLVITRKINTLNKSEWLFNGRTVPKKDIDEVIQRFNIQVNNLTQFLPQDRVCEFAKLTPVQLLEETEKAVGDPQLPIDHSALVKKSRELKDIVRSVERNGETLSNLVRQNAEQEKDVERVKQRDELHLKAENMKKKLPWLKYDMKKAEYKESEKQQSDAKKKLDKAVKTLNDSKAPIEEKKKEKENLECRRRKIKSLMDGNVEKRRDTLDEDSNLEVKVKGKQKEIEDLRNEKASLQQRIAKAKEDLAKAKQEEENLPPFEPPKDEFKRLGELITEAQSLSKQKRMEKTHLEKVLLKRKLELQACKKRLKEMESKKHKLLHNLKKTGADKIYDAYNWLQEHRSELKNEVYGPVLLEVNISNEEHADFLEGQISRYFWKSFITQDSGDRDFLVQNMKYFNVPIVNYVGGVRHQTEPLQISQKCKELGIYSRLDQVFDAPDAVKEVMIDQFGLKKSYIGTEVTDQKADEVSRLGINDFWTPENHYRWTKSRYGSHVSGSMATVQRSRLLLCSSDVPEVDTLHCEKKDLDRSIRTIEENLRSMQAELTCLEDEAASYEARREEIHEIIRNDKNTRQTIQNSINWKIKKLESLEKEDDPEIAIINLKDKVAELITERCRNALDFKKYLVEAVSLKREFAEKHMKLIEFDAKIKEMELDLKEKKEAAEEALKHFDHCKNEVENQRRRLRAAKEHAESVARLTPELKSAFREMPTTIEELEAEIQDTISQANSIMFLNPNILAEYEDRRRKIEEIGATLERNKAAQETCLAEINSLKGKWLPTLRNLVAQINETFSRKFQEMAVAGEVALDEHGTDFDQYGILIKVKFRQTGQLQVLSAHHQSGGERSVSTILYLVSLQDLTNCPFRVVDEINQGMDPVNERKMFQQLVRAASQPNTPQCFLLTPKLLSELEYSEACSVLNIMNGPWIQQPSQAWSNGESWRRTVTRFSGESRC